MTDSASRAGAIVFTDIVGFTEFTAARGDAEALALLDLQERLVRAALPSDARIVVDGVVPGLRLDELGPVVMRGIPEPSASSAPRAVSPTPRLGPCRPPASRAARRHTSAAGDR